MARLMPEESVAAKNRRTFTKGKCAKHSPPFYQCCCQCLNQLTDYSHPWTDGESVLHIRGYICHVPFYGFTHSGWGKHSPGCELFEKRHYSRYDIALGKIPRKKKK
jgi:hypothetical protein